MKSFGFVAAILGLLTASASSTVLEDCPAGQVCPLNIPIRSDGSDPSGVCNDDVATNIRSGIATEVNNLLSANPTVLNALRSKYLGLNPDIRAGSCADIYRNNPAAQNGYYYLENQVDRAFCQFDFETPGDLDEFGWERLALTDMREAGATCPTGLNAMTTNNVRYCIKPNVGCQSIIYDPRPGNVKRIYGRIYGIQQGTPDITDMHDAVTIEDLYVDGVSLTYGNPRNHIWTFYGYTSSAFNNCPCGDAPASRSTPEFVGMNYFCESGTSAEDGFIGQVFVDDPIWDAQNCTRTQVNCCNTGPWFYREFGSTFDDSVELRLCTDQGKDDEDIGLQLIELWIQ